MWTTLRGLFGQQTNRSVRWIVSELFYPDEVSTALIMTEIAEKYANSGPVGVICGPIGYEKSYQKQMKILPTNIEIHRVSIPDLNKNAILSRVLRLCLISIKMSFKILTKVKGNDSVLMVTNPAFLLITMGWLKKLKSFNLNILVHDVFPENLVPAGLVNKKSLLYKFLRTLFNNSYRQADNLLVLGEDMRELLQNKLGTDGNNIRVVPNWYDPLIKHTPEFSPSQYFKIDLSNKIVISFAGNIGRVQGLLEFIDAFILAGNSDLELVLIGDGALKETIRHNLNARKVKNINLVGSRPRAEQINFLNACDICLITLKEGMKGLGVPSKTYNVMAAKKPILYVGDSGSEVDTYVKRFDNGWSFSWSEKNKLINFLRNLRVDDPKDILRKGGNSLKAVRQNFSREIVLETIQDI